MNTKNIPNSVFVTIARFCLCYKKSVALACLALSAFFAFSASKIIINNSNDVFFVRGDNRLETYEKFQEIFGSEEFLMIYLENDNFFSKNTFNLVTKLAAQMESLKFEGSPVFAAIVTPFSLPLVRVNNDVLEVESVIKSQGTPSQAELNKARDIILAHPIYQNLMVGPQGKKGGIIGVMRPDPSEDYSLYAASKMEELLIGINNPSTKTLLVGGPAIKKYLNEATASEAMLFGSLAVVLSLIVLFFLYRRTRQVAATVSVVVASVLWTFGIMSLLNVEMNLVTIILPLIIVITGLGSCVHIINAYRKALVNGHGAKISILRAIAATSRACFFTSVTTAIGFLSMTAAPVLPMKMMGIFAALGILLSFLFTLVLLPIFLGAKKPKPSKNGKIRDFNHRFFEYLAQISLARPLVTAIVASLVALFLSAGIWFIKVESNFLNAFQKKHPFRVAIEHVDANLGGTSTLELMIDTGKSKGAYSPSFLNALHTLGGQILKEQKDIVSTVLSPELLVSEMNYAFSGAREVPDSREAVSQLMFLYEISGGNIKTFLNPSAQIARVTIRTKAMPTERAIELEEIVLAKAAQIFEDPKPEVFATGVSQLFAHLSQHVIDSQIRAFLVAALIISLIMILVLRSLWLGVAIMIPNLLPVLATYGIMGWFSIPLDWLSAIIPGVALGVAVDGTIHIGTHFQKQCSEGESPKRAAKKVIKTIGKALMVTSLSLCAGFSVFAFSILQSLSRVGLLLALCLALALLADLIMTPAMLALSPKHRQVRPKET